VILAGMASALVIALLAVRDARVDIAPVEPKAVHAG